MVTSVQLERVMGIEPTSRPWEGRILPVNYTRTAGIIITAFKKTLQFIAVMN